jgi:CRISPR system Cascade subunit CasE
MYLSRLILNPRNRRVQKEVAQPYQMHRSLMGAFSDNLKPGDDRVLFRLETARTGALTLLVQSLTLPDWSWLAEPNARGYLLPVDKPNPAVKSFDINLAIGQVLAFRLRANPTVKRRSSG